MSSTPTFTFSDLFAGIGGFHAALHAAGGTWAFASEIDADAAAVYDHNWLRPLRESGAPLPPGVKSFGVSGDIVALTDPEVRVPHADVLAAGFPCQPFSKSGFQRGMDETRGTLFWNIAKILEDPERRPSVVLLENVRNLAGPRHRDTTFKTIVRTLRELGYRTASEPAVFSPHLLPRHLGGRPQVRERVFILAHYVGAEAAQDPANFDDPIVSPKSLDLDWRKEQWDLERDLPLQPDSEVDERYWLDSADVKMIDTWDRLLTAVAERLEPDERLPGFPIWADEWRPLVEASDLIDVAAAKGAPFPAWKANFLLKNAEFYDRHRDVLDPFRMQLDAFPPSRRKFEWQAGPHRPLAETIMHFRPSGIRAKRPDYVPALVAITQTSILGNRRRLTPRETARLQGLPDSFEFAKEVPGATNPVAQRDTASYKQMGNGVNVGTAFYVFRKYVLTHRDELPSMLVRAVELAGEPPDSRLERVGIALEDASELESDRTAVDEFVPARDKLEAVNRLTALVGGPPEDLGPGSTERKRVLINCAKYLGHGDAVLRLSKPRLAEHLVTSNGHRWEAEHSSTGATVTLAGLNQLLRVMEGVVGTQSARTTRRTPTEEAALIRDVVVGHTPRHVRGRDAVTQMREAESADWAKSEWAGFYFEFCTLGPLMARLGGSAAPTNNPRVVLDLSADYVWDLKVHNPDVRMTILNDKAATDWVLRRHGGIGLIVLTADMKFDEEFGDWLKAERLRHGKVPGARKKPAAFKRRLKSEARVSGLRVLYFDRDGWQSALKRGVIRVWPQPPQPGGQPRGDKYQIDLGRAQEWVAASHDW